MSVSQQEAALITENRELRERLQGALADHATLVAQLTEARRLLRAAEASIEALTHQRRLEEVRQA